MLSVVTANKLFSKAITGLIDVTPADASIVPRTKQ